MSRMVWFWLYSLVAALLLVDIIWYRVGHFQVAFAAYGYFFAIVLALVIAGTYYDRKLSHDAGSAVLYGLAFPVAFSNAAFILNRFALTIAGPRIDTLLAQIDRAMGIYWPHLIDFAMRHPLFNAILLFVYGSSIWQTAILIIYAGWRRDIAIIEQLCVCLAIGGVVTIGFWILAPSFGAITVYGIPRADANVNVSLGMPYARELLHVYAYGPGLISPATERGLIGFPSFHVEYSVFVVWFTRHWKALFWPVLAFNILAVASAPIQGGHHVVDLLGGLVVAVFAIVVAGRLVHSRRDERLPARISERAPDQCMQDA